MTTQDQKISGLPDLVAKSYTRINDSTFEVLNQNIIIKPFVFAR